MRPISRPKGIAIAAALVLMACADSQPIATEQPIATTAERETAPPLSATTAATAAAEEPEQRFVPAEQIPPGIPRIASDLALLPVQPDGVRWPTESWPEGPLPDGVDVDAMEQLMESMFDNAVYGEIHAVVLVVGGELVLERYGNGYLGDDPHASFSMSKSVAHLLLGRLVANDQLDMTAPAAIPEWANDERASITPDMLLRMSSGLAWSEMVDALRLINLADGSTARYQIDRELVAEPDSAFNYSTGSTAVLSRIMGDLVGTGEEFDLWAHAALFEPLGITSARLGYDNAGYWIAGSQADMTARDFARLGLLLLRDGVWDGQRLLPEGWVDYGRSPSITSNDYGAGFWLGNSDGAFRAQGFEGQFVIIVPEIDVVFVVLSQNFLMYRTFAFIDDFRQILSGENGG